MYDADSLPRFITIGFTGEKDFREVEIDMTKWMAGIPEGVPAIVYVKPETTDAYRPAVTFENNIMRWLVSESDLGAVGGVGKAQLELKSTAKTRKSEIFDVRVNPAIMR